MSRHHSTPPPLLSLHTVSLHITQKEPPYYPPPLSIPTSPPLKFLPFLFSTPLPLPLPPPPTPPPTVPTHTLHPTLLPSYVPSLSLCTPNSATQPPPFPLPRPLPSRTSPRAELLHQLQVEHQTLERFRIFIGLMADSAPGTANLFVTGQYITSV